MKAYVIHYTKLKDRKNKIIELLNNTNINYEFITQYDREEINKENIKNFYSPDKQLFESKISPLWDSNIHKFRYLTYGEVSVAIKQINAIKKIAESNEEYSLILEDDVLPTIQNFDSNIEELVKNLPSDWDSVFLGLGCGESFINEKIQKSKKIKNTLFKVTHPATNCAEAYILTKKAANQIYKNILPFQLAFDWELAYHFYNLNMNVYWVNPSIFYQGSISGEYKSSLRD
jgi:GR25 family glycosyltransferase involved in LPS biosynthesis